MIVRFYLSCPQLNFLKEYLINFSAMRSSENPQILKSNLFIDFRKKKMKTCNMDVSCFATKLFKYDYFNSEKGPILSEQYLC